jgi:hypothetical protein
MGFIAILVLVGIGRFGSTARAPESSEEPFTSLALPGGVPMLQVEQTFDASPVSVPEVPASPSEWSAKPASSSPAPTHLQKGVQPQPLSKRSKDVDFGI